MFFRLYFEFFALTLSYCGYLKTAEKILVRNITLMNVLIVMAMKEDNESIVPEYDPSSDTEFSSVGSSEVSRSY